jgi:hypothetical protein
MILPICGKPSALSDTDPPVCTPADSYPNPHIFTAMITTSLLVLSLLATSGEVIPESPYAYSPETTLAGAKEPVPSMQSGGGISYSFAEVSIAQGDLGDEDLTTVGLQASYELGSMFYAGAGYASSTADILVLTTGGFFVPGELESSTLSLGAGVHFDPSESVSIFAQGLVLSQEADISASGFGSASLYSADAFSLGAGVRFRPTDLFEGYAQFSSVSGDADYSAGFSADIDYTTMTVGSRLYFGSNLAANIAFSQANYDGGDDQDLFGVGLAYFF